MARQSTADHFASLDSDPDIHISQDDVVGFLKRGFVLAVVALLAISVATFLFLRDAPPVYEASTTIYAADNVVDLRSIGLSYLVSPSLHASAYMVAAGSDAVLAQALTQLGVASPTAEDLENLRSQLSISPDEESRLLTISAKAGTAATAAARAQAVADSLVAWDAQRPRENLMRMIEGLRHRIDSLDVQLSSLAEGSQRDSLSALRTEQVSQLATAVMLSDSVVSRLEIVQPAGIPESPVAPSPVFSAVLAGLLAFALAYLAKLLVVIFDGRIRHPAQVPILSGLPLLAMFPQVRRGDNNQRLAAATGYLRSALVPVSSKPTAVLLAPVSDSEMSTRLALAVARSFARSGSGTLLISTTPRDAGLVRLTGFKPGDGNTIEDHLRNPEGIYSPHHVNIDGPGVLAVLLSWEKYSDSSELLTFGLQAALDRWRGEYDVIIIATPGVLAAADAVTVAPMVDRTVLVIDGGVKRSDLSAATSLFRQRDVEATGVVMTGVRSAPTWNKPAEPGAKRSRRAVGAGTTSTP